MCKLIRTILPAVFLLPAFALFAQQPLPAIEGWRVHVSFRTDNDLIEIGDKIFVASQSASFTFDKQTGETEILSKVNGLSDVMVSKLEFHPATSSTILCYDNTNIDILQSGNVYNVPEVLKQVIIGKKSINNITLYENKAYLACSFGVAILDLETKKLSDSYANLGPNGTELEINDVAVFEGYVYIATNSGIFRAPLLGNNLSDYNSWKIFRASGFSNHLEVFNSKLYAVVDSLVYSYDGSIWSSTPFGGMSAKRTNDMRVSNNKLVVTHIDEIVVADVNGNITHRPQPNGISAIISKENDYFMIVPTQGLIKVHHEDPQLLDFIIPAGPPSSTAQRIVYADNKVWVAAGGVQGFGNGGGWAPMGNNDKFSFYANNTWHYFRDDPNINIQNSRDFIDIAVDPNTKKVYVASFGNGIAEVDNQTVTNFFDTSNSSLQKFNSPSYRPLFVSGLSFDNSGNMWVSNFGAVRPISVRTRNGQWYSYAFGSSVDNRLGYITCDDYNNKWVCNTKGMGLLVFNDNGTPDNTNDDRYKVLSSANNNGALPSNTVNCAVKEEKGEVWVGTDKGLCIFSNPQALFRANEDFDAKRIVIKTGLVYSNFLDEINVYCIKVDAANRKWIGTSNGVWLVSPDGYTVIRNFNTDNSPLFSNAVYEIGIDGKTGEVFFVTEKGIVSYMGTATDADLTHGDVLVYPNPVRHDYTGTIAIKGLASNSNVKITDIAGNLVYETQASGGTATWNGLNFRGKRAATGVYLIFSSNSDGTETYFTKILFIN